MTLYLRDEVEAEGKSWPIRSEYRVILDILRMTEDPDLSDGDKAEALLKMFYIEEPENKAKALEAARDFISPGGGKRSGPSLVKVNRIIGRECRSPEPLHWHSFLSAFMEIGPESLYGQILLIREKRKTGRALTKDEMRFYRRNRRLVEPPVKASEADENILKEWT